MPNPRQNGPPMTPELRDAFEQAVGKFLDWKCATSEPQVSFKEQSWKISRLFWLVEFYSGRAPEHLHAAAYNFAQEVRHSNRNLRGYAGSVPRGDTYASVAQCMRHLCEVLYPSGLDNRAS